MNEWEQLISQLKDADWRVRVRAAEMLEYAGDVRAVEPLIGLLSDNDEWVRYYTRWALGEIGTPNALDALRRWQEENKG